MDHCEKCKQPHIHPKGKAAFFLPGHWGGKGTQLGNRLAEQRRAECGSWREGGATTASQKRVHLKPAALLVNSSSERNQSGRWVV